MTCLTYFEPLEDGHCTFWARMVLLAAVQDARVSRLRLVTSQNMAKRLSDVVVSTGLELKFLSELQLAPLRQHRLAARGFAQWSTARKCLMETGGQLFLPFFDHAAFGAAADRRAVTGQISGIIFRPPNAYNHPSSLRHRVDSARRWLTYMSTRRAVRQLFTLDEVAAQAAVSRATGLLTYLPDPAPDLSLLHERVREPRTDGRQVFLLFGALGRRKGIFMVLEALSHMRAERRAAMAFRFVGRVLPQDRQAFIERFEVAHNAYPEMVFEWRDNFVSDAALAQEIVNCDVLLAPYQDHVGSSGVMFWATAAGKPLIGQRTGLIGYQLEHYDLGFTVDTTDPLALSRALDTVGAKVGKPRNYAFLQAHSPAAFTGTILDGLLS